MSKYKTTDSEGTQCNRPLSFSKAAEYLNLKDPPLEVVASNNKCYYSNPYLSGEGRCDVMYSARGLIITSTRHRNSFFAAGVCFSNRHTVLHYDQHLA
jgi:hypothetical protein